MTNANEAPGRSPLDRLHRYFDKLNRNGFFGKVTVSFQSGRVCDIRTEETRKLDEL